MTKVNNLQKALLIKIQTLYDIEIQLEKALPKMAKAVSDPVLEEGFQLHLKETVEHKNRLERIFKILNTKPSKTKCEGIRGIIEDTGWVMKLDADDEVKDVMIASSARYVEHYEMAGYQAAIIKAQMLKMPDVVEILSQTLLEEESADQSLTMGMKNIARNINEQSDL